MASSAAATWRPCRVHTVACFKHSVRRTAHCDDVPITVAFSQAQYIHQSEEEDILRQPIMDRLTLIRGPTSGRRATARGPVTEGAPVWHEPIERDLSLRQRPMAVTFTKQSGHEDRRGSGHGYSGLGAPLSPVWQLRTRTDPWRQPDQPAGGEHYDVEQALRVPNHQTSCRHPMRCLRCRNNDNIMSEATPATVITTACALPVALGELKEMKSVETQTSLRHKRQNSFLLQHNLINRKWGL